MNNILYEILDGQHEIKGLMIENNTLTFTTELDNYNWDLSPIDIGTIIYSLQVKRNDLYDENHYLKNQIEDLEDTIKTYRYTSDITNDLANNYKKRIDKAIEILGKYRHYSIPDEKQNSDNEDKVDEALNILKGEHNE